ncbi:hypothetical protein V8G54_001491 [Vigna mungo]|uniref:Uncharacterized protein n=1 Tax=Vigna mungo TaxID=3915 RepID=A0AAQ3P8T2_VIGMU
MSGIVIVFDFDKTIVDVDSDNWVIDELGFTDLFNQLLPTMPWNTLMGLVIERIEDSISEEDKRFIYLGDGSGDYCPSLRLKEKDFMMPRKNFPVWDLICRDPSLVKAEIHGWSDGEELEQVLLHLINKVSMEQNSSFISSDCKLQTLSVSALEALPKVLPVRP